MSIFFLFCKNNNSNKNYLMVCCRVFYNNILYAKIGSKVYGARRNEASRKTRQCKGGRERKMEKTLDLELLAGPLNMVDFEKCDTSHVSAFDFYHPVNNFIYGLGIQDRDRIVQLVSEGIRIVPSEEQRDLAREYITEWISLIHDARDGNEVDAYQSVFGAIKPKYDKEKVTGEDKFNRFRRYVGTLCAIAECDTEDTIKSMLE